MLSRILGLVAIAFVVLPATARAQAEGPLVHPIYVHLPEAAEHDAVRKVFSAAAERHHLGPVEVVDVPAPPAPRAPEAIKLGTINAQKLAFDEAMRDLDAAAAEAAATGGAGLSTTEIGQLYIHRAMSTARADWNATAAAPPSDARTRAYADYLRAGLVAPSLNVTELRRVLPPQVMADFDRATEEVRQRPRGTLVVKGSAAAQVALDGGGPMPVAGGVTFRDLAYGEHLISVQEVGRVPWGTTVRLDQPSLDVDIPPRAALSLDDATAAKHALRMGALFALILEPKGGTAAPVAMRLVDTSGFQRDAVLLPSGRDAAVIEAAVMRLDEQARRIAQTPGGVKPPPPAAADAAALGPPILLSPPRARARLDEDPPAWARDHWPLLTAIGVLALSAIVLGAAVSGD